MRFRQLEREIGESSARLTELENRLISVQARQGQTAVSLLEIAILQRQIGGARTQLVELQMDREEVRSQTLFLAEELTSVLQLKIGDNGC